MRRKKIATTASLTKRLRKAKILIMVINKGAGMKKCCQKENGNWHGRFHGCGRRMTLPRQLILDFLHNKGGHLSAEEVFMGLRNKIPSMGLATVYRTLELLTDLGIVHKFDFGDGRARYEFAEGPASLGHHHHLVCTSCKRIIDYTDFIKEETELLKRTESGLSKKYNFQIKSHLIQFYGLCAECAG